MSTREISAAFLLLPWGQKKELLMIYRLHTVWAPGIFKPLLSFHLLSLTLEDATMEKLIRNTK